MPLPSLAGQADAGSHPVIPALSRPGEAEGKVPAGRAQPPRGHPSPGHPAATSPAGTGAMTATSGQAKSSSWSPVRDEARGWATGRAGRCRQDPAAAGQVGQVALTALQLTATYLVLPPRCSAKACGRSSPSASGMCGAVQGRALSWGKKRRFCLEGMKYKESSLSAADPTWWHLARSRDGRDGCSHRGCCTLAVATTWATLPWPDGDGAIPASAAHT